MYHFLSGYTARVAGTEKGVGNEPQATFSTCFGAPFMPRHPTVYAKMLGERIARQNVECWLVNTGWSGGAYGVGQRMSIAHTRALVRAALDGTLAAVAGATEPHFGLLVPSAAPTCRARCSTRKTPGPTRRPMTSAARDLAQRFEKQLPAVREPRRRQGQQGGDPRRRLIQPSSTCAGSRRGRRTAFAHGLAAASHSLRRRHH